MREGLRADDIYMLVEDTFLATARLFTRHIHHAEYSRQKRLAQQRNANATKAIDRPVDGRTLLSPESKRRKLQTERRRKANGVLGPTAKATGWRKEDADQEDAGDETAMWKGTHLYGLLASSSAKPPPLRKLSKAPSSGHAAAGRSGRGEAARRLQQSAASRNLSSHPSASHSIVHRDNVESSDSATDVDDDLDAPAPKVAGLRPTDVQSRQEGPVKPDVQTRPEHKKVSFAAAEQTLMVKKSPARSRVLPVDSSLEQFSRPTPLPARRPWVQKAGNLSKRGEGKKEECVNEIPIFLV